MRLNSDQFGFKQNKRCKETYMIGCLKEVYNQLVVTTTLTSQYIA